MSNDTSLNSVKQIFDLLKSEKDALIQGDAGLLQDITDRKQAWINDLPDKPLSLDLDQIRKIKAMSDQNAALSNSCQLAQKSVINRLSEIQKIQKTMGIYAVDGTFSEADAPPPNVEARS
jgi:hypothetical protein